MVGLLNGKWWTQMGSDMFMNPPQKQWEWDTGITSEQAFDRVHTLMSDFKEFRVEPTGTDDNGESTWRIGVFTGVWH